MSSDIMLSDGSDGVPVVIHKGRKALICLSDHVLDGGDKCENISSLPLAICQHLGFDTVEAKTQNSTR